MEAIETESGKAVLYPSPGLKIFAGIIQPNARSIRGQFSINGRLFVVSGSQLLEFLWHADTGIVETLTRGPVADDRLPVSMAASPQQLLVASAGMTYVLNLATNVVTPVQIPNADARRITKVGYSDSFFNALEENSQQWFISKSFDALTWDALDTTIVSVFSDNIVSSIVDHRKIWFFGQKRTVVYYISGNVFPYDVLDPIIEQGCIAANSPAQLDNSVFWLGGDERGAGIVWRAQGQTPIRISNHALEFEMQSYPTMTDAISYTYQDQGHSFYHLYFPSANKSKRYDVATNQWHDVDYFDAGTSIAHRSQNHTFIFGKHLVGDWKTATLYEMKIPQFVNGSWEFADDFGNPIRRVRRAPHISKDNKVLRYTKLEVMLEAGLGTPDIQDFGPPGLTAQPSIVWPNDQFSRARLLALGVNAGFGGLELRTTLTDGYQVGFSVDGIPGGMSVPTLVIFLRLTSGSTHLATCSCTPQPFDVFELRLVGNQLDFLQNGVVIGGYTDPLPLPAGGRPGVAASPYNTHVGDIAWDNWEGGSTNPDTVIASDTFHRPDEAPIAGPWLSNAPFRGQVLNNQFTNLDPSAGAFYDGATLAPISSQPSPGVTRPPKINMRYSNDYGHSWSNEQTRSAGLGGEYRKRVIFWRMGRARDRVIEINCSDKIPWRIVGDNMEVSPGDGA